MKKWITLVTSLLKVSLRLPAKSRGVGLKILGAFFVIPMVFGYFWLLTAIRGLAKPEVTLVFGAVLSQVMVLFFAITQVIATLFFADDLQLLLPLPYKPGQMMAAKCFVVLASEYLVQLLFFVPPALVYSAGVPTTVAFWLTFAVAFLVSPILPLTIATLLVFIMQRLGLARRLRDFWSVFASGLCMAFFVWFQLSMSETAGPDQIGRIALKLVSIERYVPSVRWSVRAMAEAGHLSGSAFLVLTVLFAAALGVFIFRMSQRLYYRGVLMTRGGVETDHAKSLSAQKPTPVRGLKLALFIREWQLFWRTPFWISGCFVPAFMIGIIMVVPLFRTIRFGETFSWKQTEACLVALGLALGITGMGSMNNLAVTVLSREGRKFWISRTIPAPPEAQIRAKFIAAQAILALALLPSIIAYLLILRLPAFYAVLSFLLGFLGVGMGQAFAIGLDLRTPHLAWDNPQEAIRRGLSGLGSGFLTSLVMTVGVVIAAIMIHEHAGPLRTAVVALIFVGGCRQLAYRSLLRRARRLYERIEV